MAKPRIKFTYAFKKLFDNGVLIKNAKLLDVLVVRLERLSNQLIDYDTDHNLYQLPPSGSYLLLIFQKQGGLFTTLRPAFGPHAMPSKELYYRGLIGMEFEVVVMSNVKEVHHG